jgi:ATP-binding cassette subfamily F protein 3
VSAEPDVLPLVADGLVSDFDGDLEDYSNWLEKRSGATATPAAPRARGEGKRKQRRAETDPRQDPGPRRQEIKGIETSLEKLGQERTRLEKELASMDFSRDPAHARKVSERHAGVLREVEQLETRWLELSERLESLNG